MYVYICKYFLINVSDVKSNFERFKKFRIQFLLFRQISRYALSIFFLVISWFFLVYYLSRDKWNKIDKTQVKSYL